MKKHFNLIYLTFALHLISISCIKNLFNSYWVLFVLLLLASSYYFFTTSHQIKSASLFIFTIIYAYVGINICLFKLVEFINFDSDLLVPFFFLVPFYFIGSIILFILLVKKFNKDKTYDTIR